MYRESKYLEPQALSLVERSIIHCPYLRRSPIVGFTVYMYTYTIYVRLCCCVFKYNKERSGDEEYMTIYNVSVIETDLAE